MIKNIKNILLSIFSIVGFVGIVELLIFPELVGYVPLKPHSHLGDGRVLAQSSKRGAVPREEWIALVGDSHANGNGDWLWSTDPATNPPFHSAHVIHDELGRDVMNFGASGAGSIWGFVGSPRKTTEVLRLSGRYAFDDPAVVVAIFYSGNDLDNNLAFVRSAARDASVDLQAIDDAWLDDLIERMTYPSKLRGKRPSWTRNLYFLRLLGNLAEDLVKDRSPDRVPNLKQGGATNRAQISGKFAALPDNLQGPAMDLSERETRLGLQVTGRALAWLEKFFPGAEIVVVYLPSPLESYELVGKMVSTQSYVSGNNLQPVDYVRRRGRELCSLLANMAFEAGYAFVDIGGPFREASQENFLHGPRDWKHPNRMGYTVLGREVAKALTTHTPGFRACTETVPEQRPPFEFLPRVLIK